MGVKLSRAEQTFRFSAPAAEVAAAVQTALESVGKVKSVSRHTGLIDGVVRQGLMMGAGARVQIQISRVGEMTEVRVESSRDEGLASSGGAQKGLAVLAEAFGKQRVLREASGAGW